MLLQAWVCDSLWKECDSGCQTSGHGQSTHCRLAWPKHTLSPRSITDWQRTILQDPNMRIHTSCTQLSTAPHLYMTTRGTTP